ncbi:MAG: carboxypeptidase regulatory-like domain-containing protein, partial [Planctomycetes bacterium]|nr:carboxypeptidase regulatory-like domain-containing protein [Planctomycetota bacterium]
MEARCLRAHRMQKHTLTLLVGTLLLLTAGAVLLPQWLADDETPIGRWKTTDEVEVADDSAVMDASVASGGEAVDRTEIAMGADPAAAEERVEVVLRGRVVDKFTAPVPGASVWLDFSRGGPNGRGGQGGGPGARQRRVPDPVRTDEQGRFAFQGQTFRNLRIVLQVAHDKYALGQFDKDLGAVGTEVDLGDLVLQTGGQARGRVTDLDGNGIANAELRLSPENGNPLRFVRDRERLLPPFVTDVNGFYLRPHLPAGDWSLTATAKRHTEGRSSTFAVEEDLVVDVDDIRLGPGYELAGIVRNVREQPLAKVEVVVRSMGRGNNAAPGNAAPASSAGARGGRGGPGGPGGPGNGMFGGLEHRTTTDEQGRFFLEHLPGVALRLTADANV